MHPQESVAIPLQCVSVPALRIRIGMFLGLLDLDPLVRGKNPDPSIINQK